MRYYILYPGNTEADTVNSVNQLGDASFKTFWAQRGLNILMNAVEQQDNTDFIGQYADIDNFIIKDSRRMALINLETFKKIEHNI